MVQSGRLPGVSDVEEEPVICHVDVDCFYAACERLREPALRGEPLVVGMGYEPGETHGAVATASYEAREYGVESAQPISEALALLPRKVDAARDPQTSVADAGFYRPVDMGYYESVASDIKRILHDSAAVVREVSIDEAYLDVTERVSWRGNVREFASDVKRRIESAVGVTASIGVAPTMSAAKVASDRDKPDGLVVVEPGQVRDFFEPLDVERVHGIGPVTAGALQEMGIETAGDLAGSDPDTIEREFGERGLEVRRFARGEDGREVEPRGKPKSFSRESAFTEATDDETHKRERLRTLASDVAQRATQDGALYRTIGIKVVTPPFDVHTRAESVPGPVDDSDLVWDVASELLDEFAGDRVRKLGVRLSNLTFTDSDQPALDSWERTADPDGRDCEGTVDDVSRPDDSNSRSRDQQRSLDEF